MLASGTALAQSTIAQWNFNNTSTFTTPNIGAGTVLPFGPVLTITTAGAGGSTDLALPNNALRTDGNAPQSTENGGRGVEFRFSTLGFTNVSVRWDNRHSSSYSRYIQAFISTNGGTSYTPGPIFEGTAGGDAWTNDRMWDLSGIAAANNAADVRIRIASAFNPSAWTTQSATINPPIAYAANSAYQPATLTAVYGLGGNTSRYDLFTVRGDAASATPISATANAVPGAVCNTGGSTTITVNVTPGQNPDSTGVIVSANLTSVGGPASVVLTGSGNTYTGTYLTGSNLTVGVKNIPINIVDAQSRTSNIAVGLNVAACNVNSAAPVVISQIFGGGNQSGPPAAPFNVDYIELYNRSASPVNLAGYTLQTASATGTGGFDNVLNRVALQGTIRPGQHFLIRYDVPGTTNGIDLPTPDISIPAGFGGLNEAAGRVALVSDGVALGTNCSASSIVDLLGYGNAICFEGAGAAPAGASNLAIFRAAAGATDSNQNFADFATGAPAPRNRGEGNFLAGYSSVSTGNVCINESFTITTLVETANNSTGITVFADLTALNAAPAAMTFDGSVYSVQIAVQPGVTLGMISIPIIVADAQSNNDTMAVSVTVGSCNPVATPVVISQVFGGGGNAAALLDADFVEIFNRSQAAVDVNGWSIQYGSTTNAGGLTSVIQLSGLGALSVIPAGGYRTIRTGNPGSGGLPFDADMIASPAVSLDNQFARVALVNNAAAVGNNCTAASVVDLVGYGSRAQCFEGAGPTGTTSNATGAVRKDAGCRDTNFNGADFSITTPELPRTANSPLNLCPPVVIGCSIADLVGGDGNPPADGSVDGNDFQAFLNSFGSGDALADIVGGDGNPPADGSVDGNDFQAFLNAFAAGC